MLLSLGARKFALTAHVASSVGWLGAVAGFLVLSIAGVRSRDAEIVRGAYVSMNLIGQFMVVPLSLAALATGLIQALGTPWGLFRHYWVLTKFALTVVATSLLLLHQFTAVAEAARRVSVTTGGALPDAGSLGTQLVFDAAAASVLLVFTTALSVYKPWGQTSFGAAADARPLREPESASPAMPAGIRILLVLIGIVLVAIIVTHLAGGGLGHH